ncbi:MAG: ribosome recycling factor [Alphaproteobacteria bacterium]|nr:MAG: ribosome recycling factor [Alphaproteobacteria bacterium]
MQSESLQNLSTRMEGALESLKKEFNGLRTGRANVNLLEGVRVLAYGTLTPLNQIASVGVPEPRLLAVQVWDASLASAVEKAIRESGLGLNPSAEGAVVRVRIPELSQERRQELVKVAARYAEQARVAVRNVRRDGMETIKKSEKKGDISEDNFRTTSTKIQDLTDDFVKKIDALLVEKEKDILGE